MHIPVLRETAIKYLNPKSCNVFVDATINGGGHTKEILNDKNFKGVVVGIDQDEDLILKLKRELEKDLYLGRLKLVCGNFKEIDELLNSLNIKACDAALFDLGMSSWHLERSGRGFSFLRDEPLLMTYNVYPSFSDLTAEKIINEWGREEILKILKEDGEERFAENIVKNILEARKRKRIKTTFELVEIIKKSIPVNIQRKSKIHPATKTFQALRITVNDELNGLKEGLAKAFDLLETNGRIVAISFHSLEDRIVKNFFRNLKAQGLANILTKKPLIASEEEVKQNPRSRSAKLRAIIKIKK